MNGDLGLWVARECLCVGVRERDLYNREFVTYLVLLLAKTCQLSGCIYRVTSCVCILCLGDPTYMLK